MLPTQVMNEFGEHIFGLNLGLNLLDVGAHFIGQHVGHPVPPAPPPSGSTNPCPGGIMVLGRCVTGDIPLIDIDPAPFAGPAAGPGVVTPGAFGALSVDPVMMSTVRLRCPTGLVLGKDDRCYAQGKGGISNSQRKWPKAPRAIMSAQDGKILRKADAVRGRVKRVAATAGFTCKKK